ncbi:hypothetical protein Hanom_Chr16g01478421 [Helianthus anomalus]
MMWAVLRRKAASAGSSNLVSYTVDLFLLTYNATKPVRLSYRICKNVVVELRN